MGAEMEAPEKDAETPRLWEECDKIYRAAYARVDRFADYVDQVTALLPNPFKHLDLSETFVVQDRSLIDQIQNEWLKPDPDLEAFRQLVMEWEQNCMTELKARLETIRNIPEKR